MRFYKENYSSRESEEPSSSEDDEPDEEPGKDWVPDYEEALEYSKSVSMSSEWSEAR